MVNYVDETLAALAEPNRRAVVELLKEQPRRAGELASAVHLSGPAMSKHLRVLRRSGIVEVVVQREDRDARVRLYRLRPEPFMDLQEWLEGIRAFWEGQLQSFKDHVE